MYEDDRQEAIAVKRGGMMIVAILIGVAIAISVQWLL
jgi:hypothetical protein